MSRAVLIMDDEPLIVAGLSERVNWQAEDCYVVGTAQNGTDGLRLIETLKPDIVITDIVMPGKTGLEIARECFERNLKTQVILLSAHSDFAFAKRALHYGVLDYVLKPIDPDGLMEAVRKAKKELERRESAQARLEHLNTRVKRIETIASSSLLFSIARYGVEAMSMQQAVLDSVRLDEAGIALCVKLYNQPRGRKDGGMIDAQRQIVERCAEDGFSLSQGSAEGKMVFLCALTAPQNAEDCRRRLSQSLDRALEKIEAQTGAVCVGAVSRPYRNPAQLHEKYMECLKLLEQGFFMERSGVLTEPAAAAPQGEPWDLSELMRRLASGAMEPMLAEYAAVCERLCRETEPESALHALRETYRQATTIASRAGMVRKPTLDSALESENFFLRKRKIGAYIAEICAYIQAGHSMFGKLKLLVEENYMRVSFGLAEAADMLGMNSSYVSRLFKKEMGKNFQEYLIDVRIEHAKRLLKDTRLRNSDIARRIGFEDDHYFGQVFKKKCGMTTTQYRERG